MGDKVLGGQELVVDGSKSGAVHIKNKNAYTSALLLEYTGETKSGAQDSQPGWYIEKLIYNSTLSLEEILIAQNKATAGSTSVTIATVGNKMTITAVNGDFSETTTDDTINLTVLDTTNKTISGAFRKLSDTVLEVNLLKFPQVAITDNTYTILESDLLLTFLHKETKPHRKRRWNHRERYVYS